MFSEVFIDRHKCWLIKTHRLNVLTTKVLQDIYNKHYIDQPLRQVANHRLGNRLYFSQRPCTIIYMLCGQIMAIFLT